MKKEKLSSTKNIIRIQKNKENPYVMLNKEFLLNSNLSWKAKGLLAYLLSKPDNWKIIISDLTNQSTDGKKAVYSGLRELKKNNYLIRRPVYEDNKIIYWESIIFEIPYQKNNQNDDDEENNPNPTGQDSSLLTQKVQVGNGQDIIKNDYNNIKKNNIKKKDMVYKNPIEESIKKPIKKPVKKFVVVNSKVINDLKERISDVIKSNISTKAVICLMSKVKTNIINFYLDNWHKFNCSKRNPIGWFIQCCIDKYAVPVYENSINVNDNYKPPQMVNYEQRKYSDEFFNGLYDNELMNTT